MKYKSIVSVVMVSAVLWTGALAQDAATTTMAQKQDEICTMSNGNRIPCAFIADAETDVATGGKVVDQVSGKEYCKNNNKYVSCDAINTDGSINLESRLQQYTNIVIFVLAKYWLYIVSVLGLALISIVVSRKLSKK